MKRSANTGWRMPQDAMVVSCFRQREESLMSDVPVDSFRFTGRTIKQIILKTIDEMEPKTDTPWTAVTRPLSESRIALLSSSNLIKLTNSFQIAKASQATRLGYTVMEKFFTKKGTALPTLTTMFR